MRWLSPTFSFKGEVDKAQKCTMSSLRWACLLDMLFLIVGFTLVSNHLFYFWQSYQMSKERMMFLIMAWGYRQKIWWTYMWLPKYEFTLWKMSEPCQSINKSTGLMIWLMLPWLFYKLKKKKKKIKMCFIYSKFLASTIIYIWENKRKLDCVSHLISRQYQSTVPFILVQDRNLQENP